MEAQTLKGKASLVLVTGATAAYSLFCCVSGYEGVALKPYKDKLARNVSTVCYGDTQVEQKAYSLTECQELLYVKLDQFTRQVKARTPNFDKLTDGQKVAVVDFAYNAGIGNYSNSTIRKKYIAGDFPSACNQYLEWRFVDGKDCSIASNKCSGIMKRRLNEQALCLGKEVSIASK